jgi:hypothetical protein
MPLRRKPSTSTCISSTCQLLPSRRSGARHMHPLRRAPDGAPVRNKMMYASTKDFMKGFLEGIGAELQATDLGEMSEGEMRDKVFQSLTRK